MSKLFKKSLAFCVAIAMVFTLFAGTISVNAEDAEETLTVTLEVENKRVAADATEAVLPLKVTCSEDTSINAIRLILTTEAGTVTNVASAEPTEDYTLYYNGQYALLNVPNNEDNTLGGINAANLLVTVDLNEGLDKEAYGITIDCRSENAADANENALKISYETGYILMPHTHTIAEEYTYDTENHWKVCTSEFCDVADYKDGLEAHVWENDGEAVTDCEATGTQAQKCLCGATRTIDVDAIGHDYEYTNDGETHSAVCKNNAAHVITGEAHNYVAGKCVCGAEEVTECEHNWANTGDPVYTDCTSAGIQLQTCSLCGETQNKEVAAKGHTEGDVVAATPATGDASHNHLVDGSITFECAVCGTNFDKEVTYYRFYACATTNLVFESDILYQFNARDVHLEREGDYEKGFIKIYKPNVINSDNDVLVYQSIKDAKPTIKGDYNCRTWTIGIPAKELCDVLTANVFVKRDGVWYSGQTTERSTKDLAMGLLAEPLTKVKETEKRVLANMLVFGAKMQLFKLYDTENLADADLYKDDTYASYITTETPVIENRSSNPYDTSKNEVIVNSFSLDMASNVSIRYRFRTDYFKEGDLTGLKAILSYDTPNGQNIATYVEDVDATDKYALYDNYTNRYQFFYNKLPAKYMRKLVTLRMYNGSDVEVSYTNITSIESLAAGIMALAKTTDEEKAALIAMINYGDAALAHFGG